jgi:hypothetical protein
MVCVSYAGGLYPSGKGAIVKRGMKTMGLLAVLLCAPAFSTTMAASPEDTGQDAHVVTGTLEELDLAKMSGKIKTDLAQTVAFTIQDPDLFKGLSVGERIAVRLDDQGRAVKVMATTLPELPIPEK